ncbi:MAG: helix-turn-helix transcriptional regulator [Lachnospiraceae bacterium]|nr:helix-turn-helix transcriptional regulator [Lachnospiraceae bacterium]
MKRNIPKYIPNYYYSKVVDIVDNESARHHHQALEIYYMKEGICNYFVGNHSYRVVPGDIIIIPGGTIHRTNYGGVAHTRMLINCSYEYIPSAVAEQIPSIGYLYRNSKVIDKIEEIFNKIENEYSHADVLSAEVLKCYTSELFFLILRNENEHEKNNEESSIVMQVLKYIQHNYMNDIKLSSVAKLVSVSSEHLSRVFKQETGFGFKEYLTILRLQKAEDMLKNEPGRAVSEVAYACGFNDGNYFSYKFKEAYGVSPTKVRGQKKE